MEHVLDATDGRLDVVARGSRAEVAIRELRAAAAESMDLDVRVYFDALVELSVCRGIALEAVHMRVVEGRRHVRLRLG